MNNHRLTVRCKDYCSVIEVDTEEMDGENGYILMNHYVSSFYSKSDSLLSNLWRRIEFAWFILIGKEYALYEIVIERDQYLNLFYFLNQSISKVTTTAYSEITYMEMK